MEFSTLNGYKVKDKKAIRYYDTVADMKSDTTLKNGMYVKTKGYYSVNDVGGCEYIIVNDNTLVDNGGSVHTLDNGLKAIINEKEIRPEYFGAKGDGITNDSTAIQNAIDYSGTMGYNKVFLNKSKYYCTSGLVINYPEFKLHGVPMTEYGSGIVFDDNVTIGIDVKTYGFRMDNICVSTKGLDHVSNVIGVRLVRSTGTGTSEEIENAMNIDADITQCSFFWLKTAIIGKGRNINIDTCEFVECENGFELDILASGHSHRDIWIKNCRFHGIGANTRETTGFNYGIAIKFPDAWVRTDTYGNIIRNNFFDYCNNIFTGCILGCTISDNNILDCLHNGIVAINPNDSTINSNNNIEVLISNNNMNLRGNESNYGIYLKGVGRPRIIGNIISNQPTIGVLLEKCSTIWFANNSLNCTRTDITENLKIIGQTGDEVFLTGNLFSSFQNADNTFVNISGVSKVYSGGNVNTGSGTQIVSNVTPYKQGEENHFW